MERGAPLLLLESWRFPLGTCLQSVKRGQRHDTDGNE